jgi:hypothetical protein
MAGFGCALRIIAKVTATLVTAFRCNCALLVFVHRGETTSSCLRHPNLLQLVF